MSEGETTDVVVRSPPPSLEMESKNEVEPKEGVGLPPSKARSRPPSAAIKEVESVELDPRDKYLLPGNSIDKKVHY